MADDHQGPEEEGSSPEQAAIMLVLIAYEDIRQIMASLPIPIEMPPAEPVLEGESSEAIMLAMISAYRIVPDAPVGAQTEFGLRILVREWLNAFELAGFIMMAGPAPWRIEALTAMIDRMRLMSQVVTELLRMDGGDPPNRER